MELISARRAMHRRNAEKDDWEKQLINQSSIYPRDKITSQQRAQLTADIVRVSAD